MKRVAALVLAVSAWAFLPKLALADQVQGQAQAASDCIAHWFAGEECSAPVAVQTASEPAPVVAQQPSWNFGKYKYPQSIGAIESQFGVGERYGNRIYYNDGQFSLTVANEKVVAWRDRS